MYKIIKRKQKSVLQKECSCSDRDSQSRHFCFKTKSL